MSHTDVNVVNISVYNNLIIYLSEKKIINLTNLNSFLTVKVHATIDDANPVSELCSSYLNCFFIACESADSSSSTYSYTGNR